ncbi:UDP-N-acetylmuramoyl-L-alanyl-D-glutamate--2,6-diaminopimelate ligase [bacterium]|nr:UDP-N-acetylmuramoyl-L-alanyl-D-glutamate--2,6-diaminopimelate ligase [bacterium]
MTQVPLSLLAAALPAAVLSGKADHMITAIADDSRKVQAGALYACLRGARYDGHAFAADAVVAGARALLVDKPVKGIDRHAVGVITVKNVAQTLKWLAPLFYNYPSLALRMVGITGTNGKTTVTYLLRAILEKSGMRQGRKSQVGLLGTIHHVIAGKIIPAKNTTPMAWDVQRFLAEMVSQHCQAAVMEVSSHALAEDRVCGCDFDVAVYTNLTPEHLDYHKTMAAYARTKRKLFSSLGRPGLKKSKRFAVINLDDPHAGMMMQAAKGAKVITYGMTSRAKVTAHAIKLGPDGTRFLLKSASQKIPVRLRLLGRYNLSNALAAAAAAQAMGVPLKKIKQGLESMIAVSGRMERVPGLQKFNVVVDYAHTPDALKNALQAIRETTAGRVILVFGCGGNRDVSKRAPMGRLAVELAEVVVITSDNPRREDPEKIIKDILVGCQVRTKRGAQADKVLVVQDRSRAIRRALALAQPKDTVLIAGKGHEAYQILKDKTIACDDRSIARESIKQFIRRKSWKA